MRTRRATVDVSFGKALDEGCPGCMCPQRGRGEVLVPVPLDVTLCGGSVIADMISEEGVTLEGVGRVKTQRIREDTR